MFTQLGFILIPVSKYNCLIGLLNTHIKTYARCRPLISWEMLGGQGTLEGFRHINQETHLLFDLGPISLFLDMTHFLKPSLSFSQEYT